MALSFRPLAGIVLTNEYRLLSRMGFRPLAGIVPSGLTMAFCVVCYRPLTGMVLTRWGLNIEA